MTMMQMPPETEIDRTNGKLMHVTTRMTENGLLERRREVAPDRETALLKRLDYYDYENGWLLDGYKWAKDPEDWRGRERRQAMPSYMQTPEAAAIESLQTGVD